MLKKLITLAIFMAAPALAEPVQQRSFNAFVKSYHDRFAATTNDIVKDELLAKRGLDLRTALNQGREFSEWEMFVLSVNRDANGLLWIALVSNLSPTPDFMLLNMPVANDDRYELALPQSLFNVARTLDIGDRVIVGGQLELDDRAGYFDYGLGIGKSESASMTRPMFAVRFSALRKVEPITGARRPTPPGQAPSGPPLPIR